MEQALESKVHTEIREVTASGGCRQDCPCISVANTIVSQGPYGVQEHWNYGKKVTVPNLIGLTLEEAMEELERQS